MTWRGVILAGGRGTRLGKLTEVTNKHLLPIGQWPMVYHAISKLVVAGVNDILIVTNPYHVGDFKAALSDRQNYGYSLSYKAQEEPGGVAQALGLAEEFCDGCNCVVLLGDNIFQDSLVPVVSTAHLHPNDALVLLKRVPDPQRYGVAEVHGTSIVGIEEKPVNPRSNNAVVGIYLYPPDVFSIIRTLKPSRRGELEITDVNTTYLKRGRLQYHRLDGYWIDAGTPEALAEANRLVTEEA